MTLAVSPAAAQLAPPQLVKDIFPLENDSDLDELTAFGDILLFAANDGPNGVELWRSSGTPAGTRLVKDIRPGFINNTDSDPDDFAVMGDFALFEANDGTHGAELWRTDGTAAGTLMVKDINEGPAGSAPSSMTAIGGIAYFAADDGESGRELWRSDGTAAGTFLIADLWPGETGSAPGEFTELGAEILLTASAPGLGEELFKTGGTEGDLELVEDINPGAGGSQLGWLVRLGGAVLFAANDNTDGFEVWTTDGSGATQVADINPGAAHSFPNQLTVAGDEVYFVAEDADGAELWRTDGADLTEQVEDINPSGGSFPSWITPFGDSVLFSADDGTNGRELWSTNGAVPGATLIDDISATGSANPTSLSVVEGRVFFAANEGLPVGSELWSTDGTLGGAELFADIGPNGSSSPQELTVAGGSLFFQADVEPYGEELWVALGPDETNPDTAFTKTPKAKQRLRGQARKAKARFVLKGSDNRTAAGALEFECKLDRKPFRACSKRTRVQVRPGKHVFRARAVDDAGNRDPSPAKFRWRVIRKR